MLFDVGYQLSSAAVLGVSYLAPALREGMRSAFSAYERVILKRPFAEADAQLIRAASATRRIKQGIAKRTLFALARQVRAGLAISLGAWLSGLPVVWSVFQRFQPWGALNSVILLPLVSIVMGFAFLKFALEELSPTVASIVAVPLMFSDAFLIWVVEALASLPGASLTVSAPPGWLIFAYYLFLVTFVLRFPAGMLVEQAPLPMHGQRRYRQRPLPKNMCSTAFAIFALSVAGWCWPEGKRDQLRMTVLSVGPGLATVIELPDGQTVLYDAGTSLPSDAGRTVLAPFLSERGIRHLDRVYLSHSNIDHFSGLPTILDQVTTGAVMVNACFEAKSGPRSPSRHLLDLLAARGQKVEVLDSSRSTWEFGGATFELFSPIGDCDLSLSDNDTSTVLRLSFAGRSVLLPGDIQERTQRGLLDRGELRADVLVLPHHGSVRKSTAQFIRAVGPSAAIRSSGERMDQTRSGLNALVGDIPLYNTADVGAVEVILDDDGVRVSALRGRRPADIVPQR
jgi:competence protein ComEC